MFSPRTAHSPPPRTFYGPHPPLDLSPPLSPQRLRLALPARDATHRGGGRRDQRRRRPRPRARRRGRRHLPRKALAGHRAGGQLLGGHWSHRQLGDL
ncbi:hypothetical protein FRC98_18855 [Lujinxingia vulgaris]|uniref:Uncharacterized protein n=1 Tax=Lujinxingia vulgaris TaxID=2600176 RepID=A0A5C6X5D8_9DELT|nr:hypothetical protein FRC98_18855 [Lujinxingia vulgaris]